MKVTTHQHITAAIILAFVNHVLPIFAQPTAPVAPPVVVNPPCAIWYAQTKYYSFVVVVLVIGRSWIPGLETAAPFVVIWCTYYLTVATFFFVSSFHSSLRHKQQHTINRSIDQ
jgi:hypothetical protein